MRLSSTIVFCTLTTAQGFLTPILRHQTSNFAATALMALPGRRVVPAKEQRPPMNEEIKAPELRVIVGTSTGKDEALGIMNRKDALLKAKELGGLDLILINDKSDPPVCKIVDYSKYRYIQEKKAKELKKSSKTNEVKEVKMSYKIDVHDYDVRKKNTLKFLKQGNRVKVTVMFRGREVQHDNLGYELLDKLAVDLDDICLKEGKAKREGRNLSIILGPRPEVMKQISDERRAEEKAKKKKKAEEKALKREKLLQSVNGNVDLLPDDDEDEDDDDDDDEDEENEETTLDDLFGSDEFSEKLFK